MVELEKLVVGDLVRHVDGGVLFVVLSAGPKPVMAKVVMPTDPKAWVREAWVRIVYDTSVSTKGAETSGILAAMIPPGGLGDMRAQADTGVNPKTDAPSIAADPSWPEADAAVENLCRYFRTAHLPSAARLALDALERLTKAEDDTARRLRTRLDDTERRLEAIRSLYEQERKAGAAAAAGLKLERMKRRRLEYALTHVGEKTGEIGSVVQEILNLDYGEEKGA